MRFDEEYAKNLLVEHLSAKHIVTVEHGTEPPDYFFVIDGTRYAVEVTRIGQEREHHGRKISRFGDQQMIFRWIEQMEKKARQAGLLTGTYILSFIGSTVNFGRKRRLQTESEVFEYLTVCKDMERAEKVRLASGTPTYITIGKAHGDSAMLGGVVGIGDAEWSSVIQNNAEAILEYAVETKREKLKHLTEPCVLLLINDYPMAEPRNYLMSISTLEDQFFRGIYLVDKEMCNLLRSLVAG